MHVLILILTKTDKRDLIIFILQTEDNEAWKGSHAGTNSQQSLDLNSDLSGPEVLSSLLLDSLKSCLKNIGIKFSERLKNKG